MPSATPIVSYALSPEYRMSQAIAQRIKMFRSLHESGCFVIPNPWDAGSARILARLGFQALATSSAGFAWTLGRRDNQVSLEEALGHLGAIVAAVDLPVNADFEAGFAIEPEAVAANVARAAATGIAGLSIEDSSGDSASPLFELELARERIRAARHAIDATGTGVLLVGRSEGYLVGQPDLAATIRRLTAYADAGAECLYAPGMRSHDDIAALVKALAPRPINVLVGSDFTTVARLAEIGVRRVSLGPALARAALSGMLRAAREVLERGTFREIAQASSYDEVSRFFTDD